MFKKKFDYIVLLFNSKTFTFISFLDSQSKMLLNNSLGSVQLRLTDISTVIVWDLSLISAI